MPHLEGNPFRHTPGMLELPLAHATHWLASLLYVLPIAVLAGGVRWQRHKDRRESRAGESDDK